MAETIPKKDGEFIAFAGGVTMTSLTHVDDWKLSSTDVQQLGKLMSTAKAAYALHVDPTTTSRATTIAKNETILNLKEFMSVFIKALEGNMNVPDEELQRMGLPSRHHHAHLPIPAPSEAPDIKVVVGQHNSADVYANIPQFGHPSEYLKKHGFYGIVVRYRLGDDGEWHERLSTRLHVTLLFEGEDVGKSLTVAASWVNPRMQRGPWSETATVLVN
jgi:hypothetical protein